ESARGLVAVQMTVAVVEADVVRRTPGIAVGAGEGADGLVGREATGAGEEREQQDLLHQKLHAAAKPAPLGSSDGVRCSACSRCLGRLASTTKSTVVTTADAAASEKKLMPSALYKFPSLR